MSNMKMSIFMDTFYLCVW